MLRFARRVLLALGVRIQIDPVRYPESLAFAYVAEPILIVVFLSVRAVTASYYNEIYPGSFYPFPVDLPVEFVNVYPF